MTGTHYTEDKLEYTYFPVKESWLNLAVKSPSDAHIVLAQSPAEDSPGIEIFIGGWQNSKSAIRLNKENDVAEAETPGILSADEFKHFVIHWTNKGKVEVSLEGAAEPLLTWVNPDPFPITHFGLRTAWGANGDWKIDGTKELTTEDSMEYKYHPVAHGRLDFEVKAKNDAHISLTSGPEHANPLVEIFLGGWDNSKCAIRVNGEKPDVAESEQATCLNPDEYTKFWVKWNYESLKVGKGGEEEPIMSWTNPEPSLISHFGIRTSWGSDGHWRVEGIDGSAESNEPDVGSDAEAKQIELNEIDEAPQRLAVPEMAGISWIFDNGGSHPEGSVVGGEDGGNEIYVVRCSFEEAVIPGKMIEAHGVAYFPWGGEEHTTDSYEVMVASADSIEWIPSSGGELLENVIPGGVALDGEVLYIGRVNHEGALTVGKVHPSHGAIYISYGGAEISYPEYEILVKKA